MTEQNVQIWTAVKRNKWLTVCSKCKVVDTQTDTSCGIRYEDCDLHLWENGAIHMMSQKKMRQL